MCERKITTFTECGHKRTHSVHKCSKERRRLRGGCCVFFPPPQARECRNPEEVEEQRSIYCRQCREGGGGGREYIRYGDARRTARVHRDSTGDARAAARAAAQGYGWNAGGNRESLDPDLLHDYYLNGGNHSDLQIPQPAYQVPGINFQEWNGYKSNHGFYPQPRGGLPKLPRQAYHVTSQLGRDLDDAIQYTHAWGAGGYI